MNEDRDTKLVSKEPLTRWADSCLAMNHLGTLIQRELPPTKKNVRAIELAERARRRAWELFNELLDYGAQKPPDYQEPATSTIPESRKL
jgi:hypothetical protein